MWNLRAITILLILGILAAAECTPRNQTPDDEGTRAGTEHRLAEEQQEIRIGTFNTQFLFDGIGHEGGADFDWKADSSAARTHRERVAAIIRELDADVLVLMEVENREVLDALVEENLSGMQYTAYLVPGRDTFTGQDIGFLSRLPIEDIGRVDERLNLPNSDATYGVSKNLWVRMTLAGLPTTLIGVHLLARPHDSRRRVRREAQAEVIRRFVEQELNQGRLVGVLGDLNDYDPDISDIRGSQPSTNVLRQVKAAGTGESDDLTNLLGDVPLQDRFTSYYDRDGNEQVDEGELSATDHILFSPRLYQRVVRVDYVHSHDPRSVSDHFPIVATLAL